jgi:hypothetical protein
VVGVDALTRALAEGGQVIWDPTDRPTLRVGARWAEVLRREAAEVREVLGRAAEFRRQLQVATGTPVVPLLVRPGYRDQPEAGCVSCGARTTTFRCPACLLAVWIALDLTPNPHEVARELEW